MNISSLLMFRKISQSLSGFLKKVLRDTALFECCKLVTFVPQPVKMILLAGLVVFLASPVCSYEIAKGSQTGHDLTEMSIEDLMNIEVTLASKNPRKYFDTPAAIYVITNEDIKRSGVTSIPEALRLAPGVEVERIDSTQWAVSIRGFSVSPLNRRMLVLVDGRSVYSPVLANTNWETVDYPLADIDRIEIIRGPGGSVWGANAVNGIINIITKSAKDTQGGLVSIGGGTEDRAFGDVRYGGKMGENANYRVYGKYINNDALWHEDGNNYDGWQKQQAGFSTFWDLKDGNTVRIQGDIYDGNLGQKAEKDKEASGGNFLGRWQQSGDASDMTLQFYYDHTYWNQQNYKAIVDTLDLDFQYRLRLSPRQEINYGLGYRLNSFDAKGSSNATTVIYFDPDHHTDNLFSAFVQDEITLVKDKLNLTLGSKFEHNDYSGYEIQPSAKILFKPTPDQSFWASASRAVRTPTPVEHDLVAEIQLTFPYPPPYDKYDAFLLLNKGFKSEELVAYELGYRIQPTKRLFLDMAAYYNVYDNILSAQYLSRYSPGVSSDIIILDNKVSGHVLGGEVSIDYSLFEWWRLHASQSIMHIDMEKDADSTDPTTVDAIENSSPGYQTSLRSYMNLPYNLKLDCIFRLVSRLPAYTGQREIPSYNSMDVRLAWNIKPGLEISIVGQNLLNTHHPEYSGSGLVVPPEVERSVYTKVQWQW